MQQPPSAADLLATVAEVLERDVVPSLSGPVQHQARVAASLVAIVERELRLGPDAADRELAAITTLLGPGTRGTLTELRAELAVRLRDGLADDQAREREAWIVLMAAVRDDLAIAKPGHDAWEGD